MPCFIFVLLSAPHFDGAIGTARNKARVGDGHGVDVALVPAQRRRARHCAHIPSLDRVVERTRKEHRVGVDELPDLPLVARQGRVRAPVAHVVRDNVRVVAGREEETVAQRHVEHLGRRRADCLGALARFEIPDLKIKNNKKKHRKKKAHLDRFVVRSRGQGCALVQRDHRVDTVRVARQRRYALERLQVPHFDCPVGRGRKHPVATDQKRVYPAFVRRERVHAHGGVVGRVPRLDRAFE